MEIQHTITCLQSAAIKKRNNPGDPDFKRAYKRMAHEIWHDSPFPGTRWSLNLKHSLYIYLKVIYTSFCFICLTS